MGFRDSIQRTGLDSRITSGQGSARPAQGPTGGGSQGGNGNGKGNNGQGGGNLNSHSGFATWDPVNSSLGNGFSNFNLSTNYVSGVAKVIGTTSKTAGKYYFELLGTTVNVGTNSPTVGVGTSAYNGSFSGIPGMWGIQCSAAFYYFNGSNAASGVTYANGDTFQIAVDLDAGNIWFGKNNVWILSGNPSTGANPAATGVAGTLFPILKSGGGPCVTTVAFAPGDWKYAAPTGFGGWPG